MAYICAVAWKRSGNSCRFGSSVKSVGTHTGAQLYQNGGDEGKIDIQQVGLAAASGMLDGWLGKAASGLSMGWSIAANAMGSGVISGLQKWRATNCRVIV